MTGQRGFSVIELLVAATIGVLVVGGLLSLYLATTRSFGESNAQVALQRQGALALDEIGRQVRRASAIALATCNGVPNSAQVSTPAGTVCYYADGSGALCEFWGTTCRNLLAGGLKSIVLLVQPAPPDPRCPPGIPAGAPCFSVTWNPTDPTWVGVDLAIRDSDGDFDGVNAMAFAISLTCSGRNC